MRSYAKSYAIHQVARICPVTPVPAVTEVHSLLSFESAASNCTVLEHARYKHRSSIIQRHEKKTIFAKYGLNYVTALIEAKKADVDPIELGIFLPTLCRKMGVPYVIFKGRPAFALSSTRLSPLLLSRKFVMRTTTSSPPSFMLARLTCMDLANLYGSTHLSLIFTYATLSSPYKYEEQRRVWGANIQICGPAVIQKRAKAAGQTMSQAAAKKLEWIEHATTSNNS